MICRQGILWAIAIMAITLSSGCSKLNAPEKQRHVNNLESDNPAVLTEAADYFEWKKDKAAVPGLIRLLNDRFASSVQIKATRALAAIGDLTAVPALLTRLEVADPAVVCATCDALGRLGDTRAVEPLIRLTTNTDVAVTAVWALGSIGSSRALPCLQTLERDANPKLHYSVQQALKRIGAKE